jgi:hypothetical protein
VTQIPQVAHHPLDPPTRASSAASELINQTVCASSLSRDVISVIRAVLMNKQREVNRSEGRLPDT